ncbi:MULTISPECIES: hypothetical protein [Thermococcus]|uniref:hypothetical protein n=1 Tax=Thermococcus TaxID=2263 RepID=UPI000A9C6BAE|nr:MULTISPECIES: hypothetical protein [Thermococcus]MCA6214752.1 hypothetical protein [Thermococcus bergensis]
MAGGLKTQRRGYAIFLNFEIEINRLADIERERYNKLKNLKEEYLAVKNNQAAQ